MPLKEGIGDETEGDFMDNYNISENWFFYFLFRITVTNPRTCCANRRVSIPVFDNRLDILDNLQHKIFLLRSKLVFGQICWKESRVHCGDEIRCHCVQYKQCSLFITDEISSKFY
jgi:hypothetical protein